MQKLPELSRTPNFNPKEMPIRDLSVSSDLFVLSETIIICSEKLNSILNEQLVGQNILIPQKRGPLRFYNRNQLKFKNGYRVGRIFDVHHYDLNPKDLSLSVQIYCLKPFKGFLSEIDYVNIDIVNLDYLRFVEHDQLNSYL